MKAFLKQSFVVKTLYESVVIFIYPHTGTSSPQRPPVPDQFLPRIPYTNPLNRSSRRFPPVRTAEHQHARAGKQFAWHNTNSESHFDRKHDRGVPGRYKQYKFLPFFQISTDMQFWRDVPRRLGDMIEYRQFRPTTLPRPHLRMINFMQQEKSSSSNQMPFTGRLIRLILTFSATTHQYNENMYTDHRNENMFTDHYNENMYTYH